MSNKLKQSTEIKVRVGPFVDASDGVTPETGVTLGSADQAELLKANGAATVDISGATWAAVTGADGWYDLTLTTSHTDTVGELVVVVQDSSVCLPVFARFQVMEEAIYDALYAGSANAFTGSAGSTDFNSTQKASINTEADTALTDYDPPTKAELDTAVANVSVDEIQATALADLFNTDSGTTYASAVAGSPVKEIADNAGGSSLTVDDIADAVWDEATSGHTTAGTFGEQVKTDIDAILVDTGTTLDGKLDTIDGIVDDILTDTAEIGAAGAGLTEAGGDGDHLTEAGGTGDQFTALPTADKLLAYFQLLCRDDSAISTDRSTELNEINANEGGGAGGYTVAHSQKNIQETAATTLISVGTVDGVVDAIKAVTDNLPNSGALNDLAAIVADTNEMQGDLENGGRLDLIFDELTTQGDTNEGKIDTLDTVADAIKVITDALGSTAATRLSLSAGQIIPGTIDTVTNTHTPTTTEFQADDITEGTADHFNGRIILFTSGVLEGQATDITDYEAVGGIAQFTTTALTEAPSNNDTFVIL